MKDLGTSDGVIVYPEGTRFSEAKRKLIIEQLDHKGEKDWLFDNWVRVDEWIGRQKMNHVIPTNAQSLESFWS